MKFSFGVQEVEHLIHIVSHEHVKVDPNIIKAMVEWIFPKTLNNFRGLLGLIGYYHKFVKNYGIIEEPLATLLNKDTFY